MRGSGDRERGAERSIGEVEEGETGIAERDRDRGRGEGEGAGVRGGGSAGEIKEDNRMFGDRWGGDKGEDGA